MEYFVIPGFMAFEKRFAACGAGDWTVRACMHVCARYISVCVAESRRNVV